MNGFIGNIAFLPATGLNRAQGHFDLVFLSIILEWNDSVNEFGTVQRESQDVVRRLALNNELNPVKRIVEAIVDLISFPSDRHAGPE